jgi:hypothetical protein
MSNRTPIDEYDRLVRRLERDLFPLTEHHHATVQMLCYHDDPALLRHVCDVMPDSVRPAFRAFVSDIRDNDYYYNARTCFEDRRTDEELHDAALERQPKLRRMIPPMLESL